ncbi:torsin-4A [Microcaecilia unicolor]|uniref:Torsin-4A n=1 Tax=Microcaecilia unicolor TaxID=1415580 RepID=A0A6P7YF22_9AMPH|nr:torsin-4A [Microcaecilia unicolor]XP_030063635.1 torsin-4A [Microcaecilia unicolor]XP_030063637.1 torsin-4A [Microcaecilia unicolor]XP_030063638.1 torsin-4A [Microcaecilia unicolor]XP_030063639.1 torsin-4A [Microcaecilia unicolor]XP_030063640.1 torsin-4A [Microcaecilia unicolor]
MEESDPCAMAPSRPLKVCLVSPVRAVVRLRRKIRILRKSRLHLDLTGEKSLESAQTRLMQKHPYVNRKMLVDTMGFQKPQYFTFDTPTVERVSMVNQRRKKKSRRSRAVLYPENMKKHLPLEQKSKAKRCLLLLTAIICFQILNAIENLDDNLQKYDLDGLEKTLQREVFGQTIAMEIIMNLLKDYLATHVHNKPLVMSVHGPSGVGKSYIGRLLARHFCSVMDGEFVLQYFVMHHCPANEDIFSCQLNLSSKISTIVSQAEIEEKIPVFIFDEVELMPPALLDTLNGFFQSNQTNEFLNAIYVLISNIGGNEIVKYVLYNASSDILNSHSMSEDLISVVRSALQQYHPLWNSTDIVPFILLERSHIMHCFLDELMREGFYPDSKYIETLARQINYYTTEDRQYSTTGCKQVGAKVNLLH